MNKNGFLSQALETILLIVYMPHTNLNRYRRRTNTQKNHWTLSFVFIWKCERFSFTWLCQFWNAKLDCSYKIVNNVGHSRPKFCPNCVKWREDLYYRMYRNRRISPWKDTLVPWLMFRAYFSAHAQFVMHYIVVKVSKPPNHSVQNIFYNKIKICMKI